MAGSSNFDHFLKVLEEIENNLDNAADCACVLGPTPEKSSLKPSDDKLVCVMSSLHWKTEKRKIKTYQKPSRYSLQRPGFIYRKKDLTNSSYLDNNLWQFTCGHRILNKPSFKYKTKVKTPAYPAVLLEDLKSLSLNSKPHTPFKPSFNCTSASKSGNVSSKPEFLPLSSSTVSLSKRFQPCTRKIRRGLIAPGKFSSKPARKPTSFMAGNLSNANSSFEALSRQAESFATPRNTLPSKSDWREIKYPNVPSKVSVDSALPQSPESLQIPSIERSCSYQARLSEQDISTDELCRCMEDVLFLPPKMSTMAEMMYA